MKKVKSSISMVLGLVPNKKELLICSIYGLENNKSGINCRHSNYQWSGVHVGGQDH